MNAFYCIRASYFLFVLSIFLEFVSNDARFEQNARSLSAKESVLVAATEVWSRTWASGDSFAGGQRGCAKVRVRVIYELAWDHLAT